MFKSQVILIALFTFIYIGMFMNMDYSRYPGYFSFYIAIFFIMATISEFTAMYAVFYESNDVKLYVHLPIRPAELYTAKILSSLGIGAVFLMPVLSLCIIAYGQLFGYFLAVPLAFLVFFLILTSSTVISLYLNSLIGGIIVRSPRRKIISTILMFLTTFCAVAPILYLNMTNHATISSKGNIADRMIIPYFRGFYDIMLSPFSLTTLINFWLPLVVVLVMLVGIVKYIMPNYYHEALYVSSKSKKPLKSRKGNEEYQEKSLKSLLVRHHLSTLQNATLLTQTYMVPLVYVVIFITPSLSGGGNLGTVVSNDYFGMAFLVGLILGSLCCTPTSFLAVGISLEKDNLTFLKALPLDFKTFLIQKFLVLAALQMGVPSLVYLFVGIILLKFSVIMVLIFLLGFISTIFLQGQFMYHRDYRLLYLNWQDVTQLFSRGGRWTILTFTMGSLLIGTLLSSVTIFMGLLTGNVMLVNSLLVIFLVIIMLGLQVLIYRIFWKKLG